MDLLGLLDNYQMIELRLSNKDGLDSQGLEQPRRRLDGFRRCGVTSSSSQQTAAEFPR